MNAANVLNIALPFAQKWEGLSSQTPGKDNSYSNTDNLDPNTPIYAYPDSSGVPTIGWGTINYQAGGSVQLGDVIPKSQADSEISYEMGNLLPQLQSAITADISDQQFAALLDLVYNAGIGSLQYQGLSNLINNGSDNDTIKAAWQKTAVTAGGSYIQGLANRRIDESLLYTNSSPVILLNPSSYSDVYSYYLRNQSAIKTGSIIILSGIVLVNLSIYLYRKSHK